MIEVPSNRIELMRKLAHIDQRISAREKWLAELRTVGPGTELAMDSWQATAIGRTHRRLDSCAPMIEKLGPRKNSRVALSGNGPLFAQ